MKLSSPAFADNTLIPAKYTCQGSGVNPELDISGVPAEAKSLMLIVEDPDAPGMLFTHWLMWNISPTTTKIAENSVPAGGIQGPNSAGKPGWYNPCPPSGTHHYIFTLYALNEAPAIDPNGTNPPLNSQVLMEFTKTYLIGSAKLIGLYKKT